MIYLVRHGQSQWNLLRRTQGQIPHPGLTDLGRRQASAAAHAIRADADLNGEPVSSVVASDSVRAVETAEIVAGVLAVPTRLDGRWREQGLGRLEGLGYEETRDALAGSRAGADERIGGGESTRQVTERAAAALGELDPAVATVVVTHGDTIRCLLAHVAGAAASDVSDAVPNGSVVALDGRRGSRIRWLACPPPTGA
ncbi:MAG: histidine phosphatase family protein [Actinomycetota bacterium]|nr:histidine phosphatase family protein [Actinomycetota bacterium]